MASGLLEELLGHCEAMLKNNLDWRGQVAAAEFMVEAQCAFVGTAGEKVKALVDCTTSLACASMRSQLDSLRAQQHEAVGRLSRSSARAVVAARKAASRM
eukprot:gene12825-biopygen8813